MPARIFIARKLLGALMRNFARMFVLVLFMAAPIAAQSQQAGPDLSWAFPEPDKDQPAREEGPVHVPGSTKTYTPAQIDDFLNAPDWFPDEHGPLPSVILQGSGAVFACGSCHLLSGLGHPESANLTGLSVAYFLNQLADYKSGARKSVRMPEISAALSDEDAKKAAEWFASLKPKPWTRVVETDTVPKTYVNGGRMRLPLPGGDTEPLGNRIIELPEDPARATSRDPHSGFVAYVPKGSIAKGKDLAERGIKGSGMGCITCHGPSLEGVDDVPRLAGISPTYIVRQIVSFQTGTRAGAMAPMMKMVVSKATIDDLISIAAYAASQPQK
jgi:cytochrome c553